MLLVINTLVPASGLATIVAVMSGFIYHYISILTCMSTIRGNTSHEVKYRIQLLGSLCGLIGSRSAATERGISGELPTND